MAWKATNRLALPRLSSKFARMLDPLAEGDQLTSGLQDAIVDGDAPGSRDLLGGPIPAPLGTQLVGEVSH
jgi:hypothetical protein